MTIAVCYVSPEGIVLGADSTSSAPTPDGMHYFNFNQKVFQLGEDSTLGVLTWGLSGLGPVSYRTILAKLGDQLAANAVGSVADVMTAFIDLFWNDYENFPLVERVKALDAKTPFVTGVTATTQRTEDEQAEYDNLKRTLVVGFCIGGYVLPSRTPEAFSVHFEPLAGKPTAIGLRAESWSGWGAPNIISRLVFGADQNLQAAIQSSPHWTGTQQDLAQIVQQQSLAPRTLPIRNAIDYVYTMIHCTIKALNFSSLPQVCGGPIEIAVITTDRKFRWVRHKPWDAAISDGVNDE